MNYLCFNLVIEVLLISRRSHYVSCGTKLTVSFPSRNRGSFDFKGKNPSGKQRYKWFPSRNRGSFDFKDFATWILDIHERLFQSRNRGSFGFKEIRALLTSHRTRRCFNLAIEVLLVSSIRWVSRKNLCKRVSISQSRFFWFQVKNGFEGTFGDFPAEFPSRNRGSFGFKGIRPGTTIQGFRFPSRNRGSFNFKSKRSRLVSSPSGFNLVIEVLLVSSQHKPVSMPCYSHRVSIS